MAEHQSKPDAKPKAKESPTRKLTIIAQDPAVKGSDGRILRAEVDVQVEHLAPGPRGYRFHVLDYDASTETLYQPLQYVDCHTDPYQEAGDKVLLNDPGFHAQNVYAIAMRTLAAFEYALGRRIGWAFDSHQLLVAPHAFSLANAFYSRRDQCLVFGYFENGGETVFTCLSHDVVAHETAHALLDGLRQRYMDPSSIDQVAFHEGFADIVALLSVFSLKQVVEELLTSSSKESGKRLIRKSQTTEAAFKQSALLGLGEQMGQSMPGGRGDALRRSVKLDPDPELLSREEFLEPHRRGEVFVAAMMKAFVKVWSKRVEKLGEIRKGYVDLDRVIEDGRKAARHLLTMSIRALDYCPPTALRFEQFLTALLHADSELFPGEDDLNYRDHLQASFAEFGIRPLKNAWMLNDSQRQSLNYRRTHFESLQRDEDEVFRFVWENRQSLGLHPDAYSKVISVRPCMRTGADGFTLRETVAEYIQVARLTSEELSGLVTRAVPDEEDDGETVNLYGGGTLIFDEYGQLKYHASNPVVEKGPEKRKRLQELWDLGYFDKSAVNRFSQLHLDRATSLPPLASRKETAW